MSTMTAAPSCKHLSLIFPHADDKAPNTHPSVTGCQVSHWPNPPICVSAWRIHQEMREWTARMLGLDFSLGTRWNISQAHPYGQFEELLPPNFKFISTVRGQRLVTTGTSCRECWAATGLLLQVPLGIFHIDFCSAHGNAKRGSETDRYNNSFY